MKAGRLQKWFDFLGLVLGGVGVNQWKWHYHYAYWDWADASTDSGLLGSREKWEFVIKSRSARWLTDVTEALGFNQVSGNHKNPP